MKEINIRLNANRAKAVHTGIKIASGDKGIVFKIIVDELNTEGTTAKIVFKRSNGTSVEAGIEAEEGVYSYTTLGNEFAVVGQVVADVKLYKDDARISTCTFVFDVTSDTLDGLGAGTGGYSDTLERMKKTMEEIMAQMRETMDGAEEDIEEAEKKMSDLTADLEALYQEYVDAFGNTGPFNPRGPYSEAETYTVRDLVTHDDASWVCYRNCTGATPSKESDCWQYFAVGAEVNLDDIIDGTTQVGNAKTLDGHGADVFAKAADLSNYLPKSGGKLTDNVVIEKEGNAEVRYELKNGNKNISFVIGSDGSYGIYEVGRGWLFLSDANGNRSFDGTASGNLPLNGGGTVQAAGSQPLKVKNTISNLVFIPFHGIDGLMGYLGFDGKTPRFADTNGGAYNLLHTGNKPTGTYTGNGDATARTIATGGIGKALLVYGGGYGAIVYPDGAIIMNGTTVTSLPVTQCSFNDGNLVLATANAALNTSGGERGYIVL